jgi:hypothetical protein
LLKREERRRLIQVVSSEVQNRMGLSRPFRAFIVLNADWNSGIVTISKGDRKKVLDFNDR